MAPLTYCVVNNNNKNNKNIMGVKKGMVITYRWASIPIPHVLRETCGQSANR